MKDTALRKSTGFIWVGSIGLLFGAAYLGTSFRLPFGQLDQPGAAVFPVIVGIMFVLVSLATVWEGLQMDRAQRVDLPTGSDLGRLLRMFGLLIAYFFALPWIGHVIATTLFCIFLIRLLSDINWLRVLTYSVAISAALYVVFVLVFNVPVPRGILIF